MYVHHTLVKYYQVIVGVIFKNMNNVPTNGLRGFLYKNLFRIIVLAGGLIFAWATVQFMIRANAEDIIEVRKDVQENSEDISAVGASVQAIQIDIAEINTTLKFISKGLVK